MAALKLWMKCACRLVLTRPETCTLLPARLLRLFRYPGICSPHGFGVLLLPSAHQHAAGGAGWRP